jgi:sterol desaturase/sphingolipid hydroxylase (fatty acid hydroxylase superfamily)
MLQAVLWFIGSAVIVDLIGYWLHRWAHRPCSGPLYRAHMTHHVDNYPPRDVLSDRYRGSGKDSLIIWLGPFLVLYCGLLLGLDVHPWATLPGALLVAGLSSVAHDMSHIHGSVAWRWKLLVGASVRHHAHHFKMGRNFGVLVPWWDDLFGTRARPSKASRPGRRGRYL